MIDIKKLSELHQATPPGEWEAQTYSVAKQDGTENGVSIYVGDDSFGAFEFGSGWKDSELLSSAAFLAETHNQFPEILSRLEQADKLESALRGLLGVIKHHETGFFIDRNCFDEIDAANSALSIDDGKK